MEAPRKIDKGIKMEIGIDELEEGCDEDEGEHIKWDLIDREIIRKEYDLVKLIEKIIIIDNQRIVLLNKR